MDEQRRRRRRLFERERRVASWRGSNIGMVDYVQNGSADDRDRDERK